MKPQIGSLPYIGSKREIILKNKGINEIRQISECSPQELVELLENQISIKMAETIILSAKDLINNGKKENLDEVATEDKKVVVVDENLKNLRDIIVIIAIYLFFSGWVYAYYYLSFFGISLLSVDIPLHYFYLYSYSVLIKNKVAVVSFFIIISIFFISPNKLPIDTFSTNKVTVILAKVFAIFVKLKTKLRLLILLFSLPIVFYLSYKAAELVFLDLRMRDESKKIHFCIKDKAKQDYCSDFLMANEKNELFVITSTKDSYYVIHQPIEGKFIKRGYTYEVFKRDISTSKIRIKDQFLEEVKR